MRQLSSGEFLLKKNIFPLRKQIGSSEEKIFFFGGNFIGMREETAVSPSILINQTAVKKERRHPWQNAGVTGDNIP
jgi:hypothetical protein